MTKVNAAELSALWDDGYSVKEIAVMLGVKSPCIARRLNSLGYVVERRLGKVIKTDLSRAQHLRPCPPDFAKVAPTMVLGALTGHYRTSGRVIHRWLKEANTSAKDARVALGPIPPKFAGYAETESNRTLAKRFKVSRHTVETWCKRLSIEKKPGRIKPPKIERAWASIRNTYGNLSITRISTIHDDAADVIRRERFAVNRCNEDGSFNASGKFWRVGWSVLSSDELLARADRYRSRAA